tara:strand:- start:623 stop:1429 length:807 start_codon:yes stop_codon:yes gene_type:complete
MLTLKSLTVSSFDIDSLTLTWEFKSTTELITDYTIDVYRSESPTEVTTVSGVKANYDHIASGLSAETYSYKDTSIENIYDPFRQWYYRLLVTKEGTNKQFFLGDSKPAYVNDNSLDKAYKEILRRKTLVLNKKTGRDCKVLKRRTFGTYCTTCYDEVLFRATDPDCTECHGTGFKTGYFPAISMKAMINAAPKYNQITMFGEFMPSDALLNTLNFPPLRPRDVIVDNINRRYLVRQVRPIEKNGVLIEQAVQISLISPDDYVYQLPLT